MSGEGFWRKTSTAGASSFDDLTDVDMSTTPPTDGQVPVFDEASGLWVPGTVTGGATSAFVGAKVLRSAAYNLVNAVITAFPFDAEDYDTDGFHDNAANNTRLTVPAGKGGTYLAGCAVGVDNAPSAGRFLVQIRKNGVDVPGGRHEQAMASGVNRFSTPSVSVPVLLAAGDYLEGAYYQDSGASRTAAIPLCALWAHRIGG